MKFLAHCLDCKVTVIMRTEYRNPNGEQKCGICGKGNLEVI